MALNTITSFRNLLSEAVVGSNAKGEQLMYARGQRRSKDVCLFLNISIDNSGSMRSQCGNPQGKTRLQVALDSVLQIHRDETLGLKNPDSWLIYTFNGDVKRRVCCVAEDYDHKRMVAGIDNDFGDSGRTRMRDAIHYSLRNMRKFPDTHRAGKEVIRYLLVLTDGADTSSEISTPDLVREMNAAAAELTNLHMVIIAVGLDSPSLAELQKLCTSRVPVRVFEAQKADDVSIRSKFAEALEHLRALIFRDASGRVTATMYAGRDVQNVARMDREAAALVAQRYNQNMRVIESGRDEVNQLMAQMRLLGCR